MAELACYFPGMVRPDAPWPLLLALYRRVGRFESRRQLSGTLATASAIQAAFSERGGTRQIEEMIEQAYPVRRTAPAWVRNAFAEDAEEGPDDG